MKRILAALAIAAAALLSCEKYDDGKPQKAVKDALEASEYASPYLQIDDIDYVETPDGDFYQVDVKVAGVEISLDVTASGVITLSSLGL